MTQQPPARCWAEIDLSALRLNADIARQESGAELLAVVKANAYGHGAVHVAEALADKVSLFGVANLHEGAELKNAGVTAPVLLLSPCLPNEEEFAVAGGYHLCVSTLEEAAALDGLAAKLGVSAHAHLALDTGMGRMGFTAEKWDESTARTLLDFKNIAWVGFASHFPSADEDTAFTQDQIGRFLQVLEMGRTAGLRPRWVHLANSAGVLGFHELRGHCNLARAGLMLYGVNPLPENHPLQNVLTWKTRITLVRELPAGHGVSYGRTYITRRPTKVATLACGYADGYPRQLSGHDASVLIHGRRCPLLGRVTMDQIMADVTDLEATAQIGEEVVLLGEQGDESIDALELAKKAGTIAWHIFTGISSRVERQWK